MADDGIEVTFVTERLDAYRANAGFELVERAARVVEVADLSGGHDLAARLRGRLGPHPVDGVICRDENLLHAAARFARDLGLPHESLEAARLLGDKSAVRERLGKAGIGSLRWRRAVTEEEGLAAVDEIGLPCVVKPTSGRYSVGVTVAWTREQAAAGLAEVLGSPYGNGGGNAAGNATASAAGTGGGDANGDEDGGGRPAALVEEYAVGRHVSAELIVQDGRVVLYGFAERVPAAPGTTAELGGHFPARFPGMGAARRFVLDAVEALGVRASALHVELLVTPTGPELIEVNGRIAGHVVTRQMSLALDRSVARDLVALATGTPVEDAAPPVATVALRALWSRTEGIVRGTVPGPRELPAGVVDCEVTAGPGDRVPALGTNHDRFGYLMVRGADAATAVRTAAEAAARVQEALRIEPVAAARPEPGPAGGEHVVLLLDGNDPVERIVGAAGAVSARLTVLRRDELTSHEVRARFLAAHESEPVAAVLSWSGAYEREARELRALAAGAARQGEPGSEELGELDGLLEELAFVSDPVHTVLALAAAGGRVDVLAVIDESGDQAAEEGSTERRLTAGPAPARLLARTVEAVRDAGIEGPARVVFGARNTRPLVLPGFDRQVLDLYDAAHRRSLVTAAAESALGRPVAAALPDAGRVAVQRHVLSGPGRFRVVAATAAEELYDWPETAFVRSPLDREGVHTGPVVRLEYTVAAPDAVRAEQAVARIERSLLWKTEPADRTHVLLLDRIGPGVWTRDDGTPLLDPDRYRVSVLSSSAGNTTGSAADFAARTDVFDPDGVRALAGAVHALYPVDRVATISERLLEPAAELRARLGTPGSDPATARKFVDKAVMKRIARRAGIRTADGHLVHTPEDVTGLFARHGRVVVKPRDGSGSYGVSVLSDARQVERWVREEFTPGTHLCEGFVAGDMCHIDAVVYEGEVIWDVSRYVSDTLAVSRVEPLSSITVADPAVRAAARELLGRVVDAWQVTAGVLHLEAFLDESGSFTFCEVAGRPGGAGIRQAFLATTGVDLFHAKILTDVGLDPRAGRARPVGAYAGWTVHFTVGGMLLDFDDSAVAQDAYYRNVPYRIGDVVPPQPFSGTGACTYVFTHDSHEEVRRLVASAEHEVRLVIGLEPKPGSAGAGR
ncbi:hypothetical protein AB0D97_19645 [Streptomyces roseus]|uniref:hypothetical protein n=1 Tax=Streptomyces roseus TaxID=66430 RepID=UPI00340B9C0F